MLCSILFYLLKKNTMAGTFDEQRISSYDKGTEQCIAANSAVIESGDAIRINTSWFVALAGVGERIDGVSYTLNTFSATNQTVENEVVIYRANRDTDTWKIQVSGGVLVQTNINEFFQLTAGQLVDFATASATTGQVQLVEILPGGTFGVFKLTKQGT